MSGYRLCPRCEARSIHLDTVLCDTCHLDQAVRGVLGLPDVLPGEWPVEPTYGIAVRRAYHGRFPLLGDDVLHPEATLTGGRIPEHVAGAYPSLSCCGGPIHLQPVWPLAGGIEQYQAEDR